jgi:hypothetical protein
MRFAASSRARSGFVVAGLAVAGALSGSAEAAVIRPTASLPLIGVPYISPTGAGCFTLASVCVTPGAFVQTSATSDFLPANGLLLPAVQDIVATATYNATITPLVGDTPIGFIVLTGQVSEEVIGRTSDTETGSFTTDVSGLGLTGTLSLPGLPGSPLDGLKLMATLDTTHTSSGTTTITADGSVFKIDSFLRCICRRIASGRGAEQVRWADPSGRCAGAVNLGDDAAWLRRPGLRRLSEIA